MLSATVIRTVYLLRHAESVGNRDGYDAPDPDRLTETGRRQAERVAETLTDLSIDGIACSPLRRARRTIRPYLQRENKVAEIWAELREACWQQRGEEELESLRYGDEIVLPEDDAEHFDLVAHEYPCRFPPADETYAEGMERIRLAKARAVASESYGDDDSLLLVGHGHSHLPYLCEYLLGVTPDGPRRFALDNVGLTKLERVPETDSRFRIAFSNRLP